MHFHYAGLVLPVFTGQAFRLDESAKWHSWLAISVILSIPMLATGVTLTKLQVALWFEPIAAVWMAVSALGAAWAIWRIAGSNFWLRLASQTFVFSMPLAIAYGVRPLAPEALSILDIPAMRAFHGSANAIGFGLCGAIGFWLHPKAGISVDNSEPAC